MAAIRETLEVGDKFSQTFKNFDAAVSTSISVAQEFQRALMEFSEGFLDGLISELEKSRSDLESMADATDEAASAQKRLANNTEDTTQEIQNAKSEEDAFVEAIQRANQSSDDLLSTVTKIAGAIGVYKLAETFVNTADSMAQITAKLDIMNDGLSSTESYIDRIYQSSQKSRGSFLDTANLVTRLGMNASSAFRSNNEILTFAENLNKAFKISGATAQEQASVILQLSQALGSGVLRGQELVSVMENAPIVLQYIADYMNVPKGAIKDLAAEGQVTAEIVKNAMLSATDDINAKFAVMPKTFSDLWTTATSRITYELDKSFSSWIEKMNDDELQETIDAIVESLVELAKIGAEALEAIVEGIKWVRENWETIGSVLEAVGVAYLALQARSTIVSAAIAAAALAINAPLLMALGTVGLLVKAFGATTVFEKFGQVVGGIGIFIYNAFALVYNVIADIANFIGNAFNNPITAFLRLVLGAIDLVLGALNILADVLGWIIELFGGFSNLGDDIAKVRSGITDWANQNLPEEQYIEKLEIISGKDFDEKIAQIKNVGKSIGGAVDSFFGNATKPETKTVLPQDSSWYTQYYGSAYKPNEEAFNASLNTMRTQQEIDALYQMYKDEFALNNPPESIKTDAVPVKVVNDVKLADEDLKIFRDIAENKYVANVELQTLAPQIAVNIENATGATPDELADILVAKIEEEMSERTAISH